MKTAPSATPATNPVNVCTTVVANHLCVGCGTCAGMCPADCLTIQTNAYGEYNPCLSEGCTDCGLCLKVCPFYDATINEDTLAQARFGQVPGIRHTSESGYDLACYAGNVLSESRHWTRSAGGLASWFLAELLEQKIVDRVACVVHNPDPDTLFRFAVLQTPEEVWNAATSCYYPVEMSEVLRTIRRENLRFAVIGLPCFLKALGKAMAANSKLADRIVVLAGLVCSHLKSKFFADYLVRLAGADPATVRHITFRKKPPGAALNQYVFACRTRPDDAASERTLTNDAFLWPEQPFKINACDFCDDVFAECADVTFMDAWLPQYVTRPGGTNLVMVRSPRALALLEQGRREEELFLEPLDAPQLVPAQRGNIARKRKQLAVRLALARKKGLWVPAKRVPPDMGTGIVQRFEIAAAHRRVAAGRMAFAKQRQAGAGLDVFRHDLRRLTFRDRLIRRLLSLPSRIRHRLKK
jgi:coenzyme F420-reducing hydrogenase beta subunit